MVRKKIKEIDDWFNSISNGGRMAVVCLVLAIFLSFFAAAAWVKVNVSDYIDAKKYQVSVDELVLNRQEAKKLGMSLATYHESLKISRERGFESFSEYLESQKLGDLTSKEYMAAKRLGRDKEQWASDKQIMTATGRSVDEYVAYVEAENRKKKEEQGRLQAKKWEWENRCERFAAAKNECAVASSVSKCIEVKVGYMDFEMGKIYCDGNKPNWFLMGEKNLN